MALSILTNVASLNAQRNLSGTQEALDGSISRMSSGLRINKAGDDAAGLGISESLKASVRSLSQAQRNANDGISMSQVAEGSMNEMQGIVSRMRELSVQAANSTLGKTERGYIHTEFQQLSQEVDRISKVTNFNGQALLDREDHEHLAVDGHRRAEGDRRVRLGDLDAVEGAREGRRLPEPDERHDQQPRHVA